MIFMSSTSHSKCQQGAALQELTDRQGATVHSVLAIRRCGGMTIDVFTHPARVLAKIGALQKRLGNCDT